MARVQLPKGCYGLEMADGSTYNGKPGGHVDVDDRHAASINTSTNGQLGLVSSTRYLSIGTRVGRRCPACQFHAQAWSTTCPRCGTTTEDAR